MDGWTIIIIFDKCQNCSMNWIYKHNRLIVKSMDHSRYHPKDGNLIFAEWLIECL